MLVTVSRSRNTNRKVKYQVFFCLLYVFTLLNFTLLETRKMTDNDEIPELCPETMAVLQEFLLEQQQKQNDNQFDENWQLSQFWYDKKTCKVLSEAAVDNVPKNGKIALISCPSLYQPIKDLITSDTNYSEISVKLFEFDERFSIFGSDFQFYDYNEPLNLKGDCERSIDLLVIDPPFLSEECLRKTAKTVDYLKKPNANVILCTGAVMEELAKDVLGVTKCEFRPTHEKNLGNEFLCLTNFGEIKS